jgi:hypothetical protein
MVDIATLVRIFEPSPTDDYVTKRINAIGEIAAKIRTQRTVNAMFSIAESITQGISTGTLGTAFAEEVVAILQKESPSFVRDGQEVQVLVCALAAVQTVLGDVKATASGKSSAEVFSAALLSSLSYLPPNSHAQIELLRRELVRIASENLEQTSEATRKRLPIPETLFVVDPADDVAAISNKVKVALEKATSPLISNARLDREELDLLWWCLTDWSKALRSKITSLPANLGLVTAAIEVGMCLRKFPGTAHHHIALRNVKVNEPQSLADIKLAVEERLTDLQTFFGDSDDLLSFVSVFPVLSVLLKNADSIAGTPNSVTMSQIEWVRRILLEVRLSKVRLQDNVLL